MIARAGRFLLLCYLAGACTAWQPVRPPPAPAGPTRDFARLRVVLRDSSWTELREARVEPDSVSGTAGPRHSPYHVAFPFGDIARVETLEPAVGRTLLLTTAIVVAAAATHALLLQWAGRCRTSRNPDVRCS
jgi:hypothetical protein